MPETPPLPVRTEPLEGEFWPGYVQRVADRFGATWSDVMGPVLPEQNMSRARWHAGMCISKRSAQRLGSYFRLAAAEVAAMHLESVFGGSALRVGDRERAQFDPWPAAIPAGDNSRLTSCGQVRNHDRRVSCPTCRSRVPGLMRLDWQMVWFPACDEHGVLLTAGAGRAVEADPDVIDAQSAIRTRLTPSEDNAQFIQHLTVLTRSLLGLSLNASLIRQRPVDLAHVLPVAVRGVHAEGYPLSQGLVESVGDGTHLVRGRVSRRPAQRFYAPPPRSRSSRRPAELVDTFPRRLPASLFAGTVSDLLYEPAMNATQRRCKGRTVPEEIAAITAAMVRTGQDAMTTVEALSDRGPRILPGIANDVVFALAEVEHHGRLEDYWAVIRSAARVLAREGADYSARRRLLTDATFTRQVLRAGLAPPEVAWGWLASEWAADRLPAAAPIEAFRVSHVQGVMTAVTPRLNKQLRSLTHEAASLAA